MVDKTYVPKTYQTDGGDTIIVASGGKINIETGGQLQIGGVDVTGTVNGGDVGAAGGAAGYKIARGVHLQVAAKDTVVTGLTTVVAVVVSMIGAPTAKQDSVSATIGDQGGLPAAGSIYIEAWKSTYAAADDFTDNKSYAWIAVGT